MAEGPLLTVRLARWRPSKSFILWVHAYGSDRLARSLGVPRMIVDAWLSGRRPPDVEHVRALAVLAARRPLGLARLSYADICGPLDTLG